MVLTAASHQPVLVDRVTDLLRPRPGGTYVDATLGLGGHSQRLLEASAPDGRVVGLDRDPAALALARDRLAWAGDRLQAVNASFADLAEVAGRLGLEAADGVLYNTRQATPVSKAVPVALPRLDHIPVPMNCLLLSAVLPLSTCVILERLIKLDAA